MAFDDFDVEEVFADAQELRGVHVSAVVRTFGPYRTERDGVTDARGFGRIDGPAKFQNYARLESERRHDQNVREWLRAYLRSERSRRRVEWARKCRARRKLSNEQARAIRECYQKDRTSMYVLAEEFGISQATVNLIITGISYRDAGGPLYWPGVGFVNTIEEGRQRLAQGR